MAQQPYILLQGWLALPPAWALAMVTPYGVLAEWEPMGEMCLLGWEPVSIIHCPRIQEGGGGLSTTPDVEHHTERWCSVQGD